MRGVLIDRMDEMIGSPALPRTSLEQYPPKEDAQRRFNEGYTLQGVPSMTNNCDDSVPWNQWLTLSPQGCSSNGGELAKGGMWTDGFDNASQRYTGSTNCK